MPGPVEGRTVIIGGGISGLSAAYYLAKAGVPSILIEARPRLGGVIQTEFVGGCTIEAGPDSFLSAKPQALELISDLGLSEDVIGSNDHLRKTFVRKNGKLVGLPDGLMMMVPTKIMPFVTSPLLTWNTKFKMWFELFREPQATPPDQSVADFICEHYGQEVVDYLAEPLLSGIYGGDPAEMSVRSVLPRFVELSDQFGSLTRGVLNSRKSAPKGPAPPLFRSLKRGLGQMVTAMTAKIGKQADVRYARAQAIERTSSDRFRIKLDGDWFDTDRLIIACEAHNAASLLSGLDPELGSLLGQVPYSSSMTVALGFNAADLSPRPQGFGFLVPKKERKRLVACTWVGTKFPNRVPDDTVVARCFLGGSSDSEVLAEPDETIVEIVRTELREIAGVSANPKFSRVFRWPRSMAQYSVGHAARLEEIETRAGAIRGLHLAGNAYQGIGIPDCIRLGRAAATKIVTG